MAVPVVFDATPKYAGKRGLALYRRTIKAPEHTRLKLKIGGLGLFGPLYWGAPMCWTSRSSVLRMRLVLHSRQPKNEWKYVMNGFDADELYNLDDDPLEKRNFATYRSTVRRLAKSMWRTFRETGQISMKLTRNTISPATRLCAIVGVLVCASGNCASAQENQALDIHTRANPLFNEKITLGPFNRDIMPVPVELTFDTTDRVPSTVLTATEVDAEGNVIHEYPCLPLNEVKDGLQRVVFVPFEGNDRKSWPAGLERQFTVRQGTSPAASPDRLTVKVDSDVLTIQNRHYSMTLDAPHEGLSGAARIIREIRFGDGDRGFRPHTCTSQIVIGDKRYAWRFNPDVAPTLEQFDDRMARVGYGGFFQTGNDKLNGVTWRISLTSYAALPFVKVRFERRQSDPKHLLEVKFQSILHMQFDASSPEQHSFQNIGNIQRSSFDRHRDLLVADGQNSLLAILLTDGKTFGSTHYTPERMRYAYLCAEWESKNTIGNEFSSTGVDVREFYLLATDDVSVKDDLKTYWHSLFSFADIDDRVRIRRLFDAAF